MASKSLLKNLISPRLRQVPIRSAGSVSSDKSPSNIVIGRIDDGVHSWQQIRVGIIGAPFAMGQPHQGVEKAPPLIRQTGIIERLKELGHDVKDYGDLDHEEVEEKIIPGFENVPANTMKPMNNIKYAKELSAAVASILRDDRLCLTLGGDHSVGLATVTGSLLANPDTCVLWVDAHADLNTPDISDTGHMHGMPIGFLLKEMESVQTKLPNMEWFKPLLDARRLAYIGLREVDPLERSILNRLRIPCYSMMEIDELGIRECLRRALRSINPNSERPLHISFDIDALDPLEAPSTGTPVRGGLTLREGMTVLEECFMTGNLRSLDLVEVNCNLAPYEEGTKTLEAAKALILSAMGYYRGGRAPLEQYISKVQGKLPEW